MELSHIIQYAIIFLMVLFLIGCHNWLFKTAPSNPFKRSTIDLIPKNKWLFTSGYLVEPSGILVKLVLSLILLIP